MLGLETCSVAVAPALTACGSLAKPNKAKRFAFAIASHIQLSLV